MLFTDEQKRGAHAMRYIYIADDIIDMLSCHCSPRHFSHATPSFRRVTPHDIVTFISPETPSPRLLYAAGRPPQIALSLYHVIVSLVTPVNHIDIMLLLLLRCVSARVIHYYYIHMRGAGAATLLAGADAATYAGYAQLI